MQSDESVPKKENPDLPSSISIWKRTGIIIVITALFTGTGGFLLGTNQNPSQNVQRPSLKPSPIITAQSSPIPPPDLTANWKTYASMAKDRPHFTLKYLPTWTYFEWKDSTYISGKSYDTKRIDFGAPSEKTDLGYLYPIIRLSLTTSTEFSTVSAEQFKNQELQYVNPVWSDATVNGIKARRVSHMGCLSGECLDIVFKLGNTIFDFSIPEQANSEDRQHLLNQILSTFTVLD